MSCRGRGWGWDIFIVSAPGHGGEGTAGREAAAWHGKRCIPRSSPTHISLDGIRYNSCSCALCQEKPLAQSPCSARPRLQAERLGISADCKAAAAKEPATHLLPPKAEPILPWARVQ